jgi:uracil-DNA glycosylase
LDLGTPTHAVSLSLSVAPEVTPLPGSLANLFREPHSDPGPHRPSNGGLTPWARPVLLINRVLATAPRQPAAHRGKRWKEVRPFSRVNALLVRRGAQPVDWQLP